MGGAKCIHTPTEKGNKMTDVAGLLGRSRIDTNEFEPYAIDDHEHGEIHFVRNDDRGGSPYMAVVWRLTDRHLPYQSEYDFASDETIVILEGEAELAFVEGETLDLRAGDMIAVAAGARAHWTIGKPFRKLVVVS